jgi:hypothetical protein
MFRRSYLGVIASAMLAVGVPGSLDLTAASTAQGAVPGPVLDRETAAWLVTLPLACVDKLHEPPRGRGYVFEITATVRPDFFKTRAFYGCSDWHSAVNSTWTMVKILRLFPDLRTAALIREKLNEHLTEDTIKGEIAFFNEEGNKSFERPYGWAWLLRLYAELKSWPDPDAQKWAKNLEPLAKILLDRTLPYLQTLAAPMRIGTHANTAYTLKLLLEHARASSEKALEVAVTDRARTFFAADVGCAPNLEPSGSDFFSPCLTEAALMSEVLPAAEFRKWLDGFLPPPDAAAFKALTMVLDMPGAAEDLKKSDMLGAKAHLIGLGASRAKSLVDIAAALPAADPRVARYRSLAASQAQSSIKAMYEAAYAGTHWIATYVLDYLISDRRKPTSD